MASQICGHEGCTCDAREDGYCSDYCAKHGSKENHVAHECNCGHAACESAATAA